MGLWIGILRLGWPLISMNVWLGLIWGVLEAVGGYEGFWYKGINDGHDEGQFCQGFSMRGRLKVWVWIRIGWFCCQQWCLGYWRWGGGSWWANVCHDTKTVRVLSLCLKFNKLFIFIIIITYFSFMNCISWIKFCYGHLGLKGKRKHVFMPEI